MALIKKQEEEDENVRQFNRNNFRLIFFVTFADILLIWLEPKMSAKFGENILLWLPGGEY